MITKVRFLIVLAVSVLFIQCKQEPILIQPKINHLSDFESGDGEIFLNISGGKAPYIVEWSNLETDTTLLNLSAGIYYITITDSKKNILIDTFEVKQPKWPICIDTDGNSYKTSIIGNQVWMAENLRVTKNAQSLPIESYVYNNDDANAKSYGRLYTWQTVMNDSVNSKTQGICPDGWHVPSDEEWGLLIDNISTSDNEIPNIKLALDLSYAGFYNNTFNGIDNSVSFWTSTETNDNAWKRYFHKSLSKAFRYHEKKSNAISVRCIKN